MNNHQISHRAVVAARAMAGAEALSNSFLRNPDVTHIGNGAFHSKGRCRAHTESDQVAFSKRVAKRRAKKGYR